MKESDGKGRDSSVGQQKDVGRLWCTRRFAEGNRVYFSMVEGRPQLPLRDVCQGDGGVSWLWRQGWAQPDGRSP